MSKMIITRYLLLLSLASFIPSQPMDDAQKESKAMEKSGWYQSVLKILEQKGSFYSYEKSFKAPMPEDGVYELINLYGKGEIDAHEQTVFQALSQLPTAKIISCVAQKIESASYDRVAQPYRKKLLEALHPIAVNTPHRTQLEHAYKKYTEDLYSMYIRKPHGTDFNELIAAFPGYYQVNAQRAQKQLAGYLERTVKDLGHYYSYFNSLEDRQLRLLVMAHRFKIPEFTNHAATIIAYNSDMYLALAFAHPELAQELDGTALDVCSLVKTVITNPKEKYDYQYHPFHVVLSKGTAYHVRYQDEIAAQLPAFFDNIYNYQILMGLLNSPSPVVQQRATDILIELASKRLVNETEMVQEMEVRSQQQLIKDLLNKFSGNPANTRTLLDAFKKQENHYGIQSMIVQSIGRKDSDHQWQQLVCDYLHLSPDVVAEKSSAAELSAQEYITMALTIAQQVNSISYASLYALLQTAPQTGLSVYIDPHVTFALSCDAVLLNETAPLTQRAALLNTVCIQNRTQTTERIIAQLPQSVFKEYADTLLRLLRSSAAPSDAAARYPHLLKLSELHRQYPELPAIPKAYVHHFGQPYNPWLFNQSTNTPIVITDLNYSCAQLGTQPLVFGYLLNDTGNNASPNQYRLAAYSIHGIPVWASGRQHPEDMPFRLFGQHIYCPTNQKTIIQYDQATGAIISELPLSESCNQLFITPAGILYSVGKEFITIYDINTKKCVATIPYPSLSSPYFANIVGQRLVFPAVSYDNLLVVNPDGTSTNLPINSNEDFDSTGPSSGTDRYLLHCTAEGKQRYLSCLDFTHKAIVWKYPIDSAPYKPVIIANEEKKYFVLTKQTLIALESPEGLSQHPRELWRLPITSLAPNSYYPHFDNIILSPDQSTLLVTTNLGKSAQIFQIAVATGQPHSLGDVQIDWGILLHYIGLQDGKVYLQHKKENYKSRL